jgi:biotin carboxyl carrier protein
MTEAKKPKKQIKDACAGNMDCRELTIGGTAYKTQFTRKFENRKVWTAPNPKRVISYIPGTINEVFIKEGQFVEADTPVFILEAMKMRNIIRMPLSGKVKLINVAAGDKIPKGHLMLEIA